MSAVFFSATQSDGFVNCLFLARDGLRSWLQNVNHRSASFVKQVLQWNNIGSTEQPRTSWWGWFTLCSKFLSFSLAGNQRLDCRPPFEKEPAEHRFSKQVWLFSFSSREESGHAMRKDLPGRPGRWVDGGEPGPAAQGWWPRAGKTSWGCCGEGAALWGQMTLWSPRQAGWHSDEGMALRSPALHYCLDQWLIFWFSLSVRCLMSVPGCRDTVVGTWQNVCEGCFGNLVHYIRFLWVCVFWGILCMKCTEFKIIVWVLTMIHSCVTPLPPSSYRIFLSSPKSSLMFLSCQFLPPRGNHLVMVSITEDYFLYF